MYCTVGVCVLIDWGPTGVSLLQIDRPSRQLKVGIIFIIVIIIIIIVIIIIVIVIVFIIIIILIVTIIIVFTRPRPAGPTSTGGRVRFSRVNFSCLASRL